MGKLKQSQKKFVKTGGLKKEIEKRRRHKIITQARKKSGPKKRESEDGGDTGTRKPAAEASGKKKAAAEKKDLKSMDVDEFLKGDFLNDWEDGQEEEEDQGGASDESDDEDEEELDQDASDEEDEEEDDTDELAAMLGGDEPISDDGGSEDEEDDREEEAGKGKGKGGLKAENKKLRSQAAKHKAELEALKEKDPEFYKYLQEQDKQLLDFNESDEEEEEGEGQGEDKAKDEGEGEGEGEEGEEPPAKKGVVLTTALVDAWCKASKQDNVLGATRNLLRAFRTACHYGDSKENEDDASFSIPSSNSFNKIMVFTLREMDGILRKMLGDPTVAAGDRDVPMPSGSKLWDPRKSPRWKKLEPLVKTFLGNALHVLAQMTDNEMVAFTLRRLSFSITMLAAFPKIARKFLKTVLDLWGKSEGVVQMQAFLFIRQMCISIPSFMEPALKGVYKAFTANAKFVTATSIRNIHFMTNCVVELYALDADVAYELAFTYIRQLAILLRSALTLKTKDSYRGVYNWQFINCCDLWVKLLCTAPEEKLSLRPLVYPLSQVITGVMRMVPTLRYFPLRLHAVRQLNALAAATGHFIPVAPVLLELFHFADFKRPPKAVQYGGVDLDLVLRVTKQAVRSRGYQEDAVSRALLYLTEHLAQWAYSIAFPELAFPVLVQLRKLAKEVKVDRFRIQLKQLAEQIEANAAYVSKKRDGVSISPKDVAAATAFLSEDREQGRSKLVNYANTLRSRLQQRKEALKAEGSDDFSEGSGGDVMGEGNDEDDEDDSGNEGGGVQKRGGGNRGGMNSQRGRGGPSNRGRPDGQRHQGDRFGGHNRGRVSANMMPQVLPSNACSSPSELVFVVVSFSGYSIQPTDIYMLSRCLGVCDPHTSTESLPQSNTHVMISLLCVQPIAYPPSLAFLALKDAVASGAKTDPRVHQAICAVVDLVANYINASSSCIVFWCEELCPGPRLPTTQGLRNNPPCALVTRLKSVLQRFSLTAAPVDVAQPHSVATAAHTQSCPSSMTPSRRVVDTLRDVADAYRSQASRHYAAAIKDPRRHSIPEKAHKPRKSVGQPLRRGSDTLESVLGHDRLPSIRADVSPNKRKMAQTLPPGFGGRFSMSGPLGPPHRRPARQITPAPLPMEWGRRSGRRGLAGEASTTTTITTATVARASTEQAKKKRAPVPATFGRQSVLAEEPAGAGRAADSRGAAPGGGGTGARSVGQKKPGEKKRTSTSTSGVAAAPEREVGAGSKVEEPHVAAAGSSGEAKPEPAGQAGYDNDAPHAPASQPTAADLGPARTAQSGAVATSAAAPAAVARVGTTAAVEAGGTALGTDVTSSALHAPAGDDVSAGVGAERGVDGGAAMHRDPGVISVQVLKMVGEGAYGRVMKCRDRTNGELVAVKEFKILDDDPDAEDVRKTSLREVMLLKSVQHPNIVQYKDEFYVGNKIFIVMEFIPRNLLEVLEDSGNAIDHELVKKYIYQLIKAITFIHSQDIIYRDIKPENLLIDNNGTLKLCDFGFARYIGQGPALTDYVATRWYRAPELLLGPPFPQAPEVTYGKGVDMWAIGCLLGELLDGEPLFAGESDIDQLYKIQKMQGELTPEQQDIFQRNPHNAGITFNMGRKVSFRERYLGKMTRLEMDFAEKLLAMDPNKRMAGEQALKHAYFDSASWLRRSRRLRRTETATHGATIAAHAAVPARARSMDDGGLNPAALLRGSTAIGS
eukprot:jgi/Mesvir1/5953/Mv00712-RA.1